MVGYLDPDLKELEQHLDGRLAQVTELFSVSTSPSKNRFSEANNGVALATLIDKAVAGDQVVNDYLTLVNSDLEDDEN